MNNNRTYRTPNPPNTYSADLALAHKAIADTQATCRRLSEMLDVAICHIERMNLTASDEAATPESELESMKAALEQVTK